jgi:hypothetical protein
VEIDRNAGHIRLKALISRAFTEARDLEDMVANGEVAGAGFEQISLTLAYRFARWSDCELSIWIALSWNRVVTCSCG